MVQQASKSWIAVSHVGKFRKGHIYTSDQLGVLGRMAAHTGHLIPYVEELPSSRPRKKPTQTQRRKRGWADGEPGAVESGTGQGDTPEAGQA